MIVADETEKKPIVTPWDAADDIIESGTNLVDRATSAFARSHKGSLYFLLFFAMIAPVVAIIFVSYRLDPNTVFNKLMERDPSRPVPGQCIKPLPDQWSDGEIKQWNCG